MVKLSPYNHYHIYYGRGIMCVITLITFYQHVKSFQYSVLLRNINFFVTPNHLFFLNLKKKVLLCVCFVLFIDFRLNPTLYLFLITSHLLMRRSIGFKR